MAAGVLLTLPLEERGKGTQLIPGPHYRCRLGLFSGLVPSFHYSLACVRLSWSECGCQQELAAGLMGLVLIPKYSFKPQRKQPELPQASTGLPPVKKPAARGNLLFVPGGSSLISLGPEEGSLL